MIHATLRSRHGKFRRRRRTIASRGEGSVIYRLGRQDADKPISSLVLAGIVCLRRTPPGISLDQISADPLNHLFSNAVFCDQGTGGTASIDGKLPSSV